MLYTRTELKEMNTFEKCKIPLERYMHKFVCERKNIKRLKWHEKNFLFDNMRILRDDNNNIVDKYVTVPIYSTDDLIAKGKQIVKYYGN